MPSFNEGPPLVNAGKKVDPAVLEVMGKKASIMYLQKGVNLNDAITKLASGSGLNPDHIRRISEFANNATHQSLYGQSEDKLFTFPLAESEKIIQGMNDGSGDRIPVVSDRDAVRGAALKLASNKPYFPGIDGIQLKDIFVSETTEPEYKLAAPNGDLERLMFLTEDAGEHLRAQRNGLSILLDEADNALQYQIKQASLYDLTLRDIVGALTKVATRSDILQAACLKAAANLGQEFHFMARDQTTKTASGHLNLDHPLLQAYQEFEALQIKDNVLKKASEKLAAYRTGVKKTLSVTLSA